MSEQSNANSGFRRASPWPVFVALGFALSELGIFVGLYPVAVGGLLLLGVSVAGILQESAYTADIWRPLVGLGVAFAVFGLAIIATQIDLTTLDILAVVSDPNGIVGRGLTITGAGVILFAVGLVGSSLE